MDRGSDVRGRHGFGIYARRVLAKSWSGDVAITPAHALVMRGPYALVRHPIYLGLLVAQLGMIIALGEVRALVFVYGIDRLLKKLPLEEAASARSIRWSTNSIHAACGSWFPSSGSCEHYGGLTEQPNPGRSVREPDLPSRWFPGFKLPQPPRQVSLVVRAIEVLYP